MAANWKDLMEKNPTQKWESIVNKPDASKLRKKLTDGIDATLQHIKDKKGEPRKGWFTTKDGWSKVQLKNGSGYVPLDGNAYAVVPAERVADFYTALKAAINAGEFDTHLETAAVPQTGERKKREWTPEQKAAQSERMKAAREAKGKK